MVIVRRCLFPLSLWLVFVGCLSVLLFRHDGTLRTPVQVVVFDDSGGFSEDYEKFVAAANAEGTRVEVYGRCDSACVRKISVRNFCMGPYATFAVHEARNTSSTMDYDYVKGTRSETGTQKYRLSLPTCARELFDARNGFTSGTAVRVSGAELRAACPQLRLCDFQLTYWRHVENLWQMHAEGFRKYGMEMYR